MNYQEMLERLRRGNYYHAQIEEAADVIESLLTENEQLKAELAKYRDAPAVWVFSDRTWTEIEAMGKDHGGRKALIIKPGENK